jgi:hypothetical protein
VWIGTDVTSGGVTLNLGQLAFGAPVSITNYIGATGDGVTSNWAERLTKAQKIFAVPVKIKEGSGFTLGDGTTLTQMKIYHIHDMPAGNVPPRSCIDLVREVKGLSKKEQVTSVTPPTKLGNLSLNAYPADEDSIDLHLCNPTDVVVISPSGNYSFLGIR